MVYRVAVSQKAHRDLRCIQRYISVDSPQVAARLGQLFFSKEIMLGTHPEIERVVPEISNFVIREIVVKRYRIIYKVDHLKKEIRILRYWHADRATPDIRD